MRREPPRTAADYAPLAFPALMLIVFFVVPFSIMIAVSFFKRDPAGFYKPDFVIDNYARFLSAFFGEVLGFSLMLAVTVAVCCIVIAFPFTYLLTRRPRRVQTLWLVGLLSVLSQTLRAIIHSRVEIGMANYSVTYPGTDIVLVEPNQQDAEMFFTNLFSYNSRRRMCENAYQQTRMMLWERRRELAPKLERHGLRLKLPVLRDSSLSLVKSKTSRREDRFGLAMLSETLDNLERQLKIAVG